MKPIKYKNTSYYLKYDVKIHQKVLCVEGDTTTFQGEERGGVFCCPLTDENALALRARLPWLNPRPLGLATSFGFGDRMGVATAGHLKAVRGTGIAPIFAQQSVRENERTGRTPQDVLNDALWVVFEEDWRDPWGADADHLKETADFPPFMEVGYSFYTIDPNLHVDNDAHTDPLETLQAKAKKLPWDMLEDTLDGVQQRYLKNPIVLGKLTLEFSEDELFRAMGKYGRAVAHIKSLSDYLIQNLSEFDLEASVDETDTPTTVKEHYYIANELRRLDVPFVSLAPRFVGSFQKGVDYIGDVAEFDREMAQHAEVMHAIGDYKMSIHTGSDKFSIYPSVAEKAKNLVHVKTAGTSYLEALKVVAAVDKPFFRKILDYARQHYEIDRATYHLYGKVEKVPPANELSDDQLLALFNQFDARQVLHVTFGSVLDKYGKTIFEIIGANQGQYEEFLIAHFKRHLAPYIKE
ncbi:MAG: tagaturonate epimerase family protein [Anaerolineales bacterium]|jgi:hypothetical protein